MLSRAARFQLLLLLFLAVFTHPAASQKVTIGRSNRSQFSLVGLSGAWACHRPSGRLGKLSRKGLLRVGSVVTYIQVIRETRLLRSTQHSLSRALKRARDARERARIRKASAAAKRRLSDLAPSAAQCRALRSGGGAAPTATSSPGTPPPSLTAAPSATPIAPGTAIPATATPTPTITNTPTATPAGWIHNPYYTSSQWKLWGEDQTPVMYTATPIAPPASQSARLYPNMPASTPYPGQFLAIGTAASEHAGFWDDAYKTEDNQHSFLPVSWSSGAASINLADQFIRVNFGDYGANPSRNMLYGINFTSQSTTCMGHNLVEGYEITSSERYYHFANTIRGGPSYYSFRDHRPERTIDSYESLPVVGFHSFGRSSSEVHGLFKMLVAGGYLPRRTKDLLKRSGLYPATLLYIYKASLPYANADGSPVDYANELRHRPGYLTNGNSSNAEFMPYNQWYHRYNNAEHFYNMVQLASTMTVPPPIALLRFVEITRTSNGTSHTSPYSSEAGFSNVKALLSSGETVTLKIDVGQSFDLNGLPLSYKWSALHAEQRNVTIEHLGGTLYTITAVHNPDLPKMRIPILFTVSNGVYDSNPAVVSFYPPNSTSCQTYQLGDTPAAEANVNYRPAFASSAPGDITIRAGQSAEFDLSCSDPEGYPTRLYRWAGEPGTLSGNHFTFPTGISHASKTYAFHFICSDNTGGYNSLEQRVVVQP